MPLKTIIKTFFLSLLFLANTIYATKEDNGDMAIFLEYADGVNIDNDNQYLIGFGLQLSEKINDVFSSYGRIALTMPLSDDNNPDNDFNISQIETGVGFKASYVISPYIGAGLVVGEHEDCTTDAITSLKTCEDDFHLGIYPEYGLGVSIGKKLLINIYARNYLMTEGVQDFRVVGINLGVYFSD